MVLDSKGAGGVGIVLEFSDGDVIEFDFNLRADAGDAVEIPAAAFQGAGDGGFLEAGLGGFGFGSLFLRPDPSTSSLVVESGGPFAVGAVTFGLIAEDLAGFDVATEHDAGVCLAFGEVDFALEHEVGEVLLGDHEEFLIGGEEDFAVDEFSFAVGVGVGPLGEVVAKEVVPAVVFFGSGFCGASGAGKEEGGDGDG